MTSQDSTNHDDTTPTPDAAPMPAQARAAAAPKPRQVTLGHIIITIAVLISGLLAWHPWQQPPKATSDPAILGEHAEKGGKVRCYANDANMSCVFIPDVK
ncbi:hypothetical protein [Tsukamurella spumae]|uniref:Uncharacterized protein n=1 Tax=Tsukamurella spumae TaxID=44753 RepID=A0A846X490_9ACTN|nr:hypothetical protein [Tsukamurella spumae]NKY19963.1 hypothetical protein [Tsukamurella spumae]